VLRKRRPDMPRPFRLWLYPLTPIVALLGFTYIVISRSHFEKLLILAAVVAAVGTVVFLARKRSDDGVITSEGGAGT